MNYSRRQLEAFGETLGESTTRLKPGGRVYGSGGGGGPSTTTVNQSSIPEWLRPQVEGLLGGATQQFFNTTKNADGTYDITGTRPFTPYSANPADYMAGFSPMQQQVQANVANLGMPGQYQQASQMAGMAGQGGMGSAQQAYDYGNMGAGYGQQGAQLGMQGGQYYGGMGAQAGRMGQQLGMQGGQYYGGMGAGYGQQAAGLAGSALGTGQLSSQIGQMGLEAQRTGRDITGQSQNYAAQQANIGNMYGQMATSPAAYQAYMSPYQQNVTDLQIAGAQRQADIAAQSRGAQAAKAGAFGGARQAIENAEANRALQSQLQSIQAQGLQNAYQQAQGNILNRAQLEAQGLGGAQSGLGTALQGGQLGLSGIGTALQGQQGNLAGINAANQAYQTGMQGAGMGLQGVQQQLAGTAQGMQGAGVGLQGVGQQLAGTGQGMQGAGVGLQGVSGAQSGYGLGNQTAGILGTLGNQQLAAQTGILGLQNQIGQQQQQYQQDIINQAINNYAQAQQAPMQAFNNFNALLRGYAVPGTTSAQYQAQPTLVNQVAGLGTAGVGALALSNAMGKT